MSENRFKVQSHNMSDTSIGMSHTSTEKFEQMTYILVTPMVSDMYFVQQSGRSNVMIDSILGASEYTIDWGDGNVDVISGSIVSLSHNWSDTAIEHTVNISFLEGKDAITQVSLENQNIKEISDINEFKGIYSWNLPGNELTGTLDVSSDLINLSNLTVRNNAYSEVLIPSTTTTIEVIDIGTNQLTVFSTYSTWVNLQRIDVSWNNLTTFNAFDTWVDMMDFNISRNNIASVDLFGEWENVLRINVANNNISSLATFDTWIYLYDFSASYNILPSFTTYAEWVSMRYFSIGNNLLTSIILHQEWVIVEDIEITHNDLGVFQVYPEWVELSFIGFSHSTSITSFHVLPEWVNLYDIFISDCPLLTDVTIPTTTPLIGRVIMPGNALTEASVNGILVATDANRSDGSPWDEVKLELGSNAAPTGAGIVARDSLIAKGWTITTN